MITRKLVCVSFVLVCSSYLLLSIVAQDVAPRLRQSNEGRGSLLSLSETKTALEESLLDWKQGMDEAAEVIVNELNERHQQLKQKTKFDLEELDYDKSAVFQGTMYSLQLRVGRTYMPFSFLTKMRPRFSWLEPLSTLSPSLDGSLPPITLTGPIELFFTHSQEVDLRIPHYTDAGLVKRVGLSDAVNVTIYGLKGIELIAPIDVSVSSRVGDNSNTDQDLDEENEHTPQIVLQWMSPPKLRLYFSSRIVITSTNSERLKVKRTNRDSIDLYKPTIVVPSPEESKQSKKKIFGELPLDMEDSRAFWETFKAHSKHFINSETNLGSDSLPVSESNHLSIDNLQILGGKAEAVLGFWISLRVSEWEEGERGMMSPQEVRASGLTPIYSKWKGLAIATTKQHQVFPYSSQNDGLIRATHPSLQKGRNIVKDKYDWKNVAALVRAPQAIPEVTLERWMVGPKSNNSLSTQLEELQSLLGTSRLMVGVEDRPPE